MEEPTQDQIKDMKKTFKGKYKLWKLGVDKFKQDPPIYRIHLMQGLAVKLTIYMIIFASIYAVSVGFWVFALIILPVGTLGNYYAMKSHMIKYREVVKNYELAGLLKPIEEDISKLRKKWRTIEKQIGFLGLDIMFFLLIIIMSFAWFSNISLLGKLGYVSGGIVLLTISYFTIIYKLCYRKYKKND